MKLDNVKGAQIVKKLYKENDLNKNDIYYDTARQFVTITRSGIEKLALRHNIKYKYEFIKCEKDMIVIKGDAYNTEDNTILSTTSASATKENSNSRYLVEIAEKRFKSRACLMALNYYSLGVFGKDELE